MNIYIVLILIIVCLAAAVFYQRDSQRKLLQRMEKMLTDARNGFFQPERMDEAMISSIENSMKLFLQESLLNEENFQEQRDKIQTLISDISHQTITPLSNIMIYSQLLEEELSENAHQQKVQAIRKQAEKLDFLLQSLVKTSRLETGIIKTVAQSCDLWEMMRSVVIQGAQKAGDKNIRIIFDDQASCGVARDELADQAKRVFAMCDPKWTGEACFNILDNAIKYTGEGGRIEISITSYQMFARIDIKDDGIGIEESELPKIFGRFYRSVDASNEEGVGLGLYLARQIVESQSGYIKATSIVGKGSCFSVFLPELY